MEKPSEKYDFVSWEYYSQLKWKVKVIKFMFQTTKEFIMFRDLDHKKDGDIETLIHTFSFCILASWPT